MVVLYVLKVPEFASLAEVCGRLPGCKVTDTGRGFMRIESSGDLVLNRKDLRFKPAVWYSCLSGGLHGRIAEYGRDTMRLTAA